MIQTSTNTLSTTHILIYEPNMRSLMVGVSVATGALSPLSECTKPKAHCVHNAAGTHAGMCTQPPAALHPHSPAAALALAAVALAWVHCPGAGTTKGVPPPRSSHARPMLPVQSLWYVRAARQ